MHNKKWYNYRTWTGCDNWTLLFDDDDDDETGGGFVILVLVFGIIVGSSNTGLLTPVGDFERFIFVKRFIKLTADDDSFLSLLFDDTCAFDVFVDVDACAIEPPILLPEDSFLFAGPLNDFRLKNDSTCCPSGFTQTDAPLPAELRGGNSGGGTPETFPYNEFCWWFCCCACIVWPVTFAWTVLCVVDRFEWLLLADAGWLFACWSREFDLNGAT